MLAGWRRRDIQEVLRQYLAEPFAEQRRFGRRRIQMGLRVVVSIGRDLVADHEVAQRGGQEACADGVALQDGDDRIRKRGDAPIELLPDGFVASLSSARERAIEAVEQQNLER